MKLDKMKHRISRALLAAVMLVSASGSAIAQAENENVSEDISRPHAIKVNPISIILGTYGVAGELGLTKSITAQLGVAYVSRTALDGIKTGDMGIGIHGLQVAPEGRVYVINYKGGASRFYIGAFMRYYKLSTDSFPVVLGWGPGGNNPITATQQVNLNSLQGGFMCGYQFKFKNGITLDFNMGPYRRLYMSRVAHIPDPVDFNGRPLRADEIDDSAYGVRIGFRTSGGVGYAF